MTSIIAAEPPLTQRNDTNPKDAADHIEEFVFKMVHDCRAPVRSITCLVEWACEDIRESGVHLPTQAEKDLGAALAQCQYLDRLMVDLLEFAGSKHVGDAIRSGCGG